VILNYVWACAKLWHQAPILFQMLESNADWLFQSGKAQDKSNCVWAYAKL
jgi:hypothetical protein